MTINKVWGHIISYVGTYLPQLVFAHGQFYVALSRGMSMSTTKVLIKTLEDPNLLFRDTKNVVNKDILL